MTQYPKRLIEVDLPIKRISAHARREKSIRHGHISTLHIWWARRPLAACRAVICASLWPDPVDVLCPGSFRITARKEMLSWAQNHIPLLSRESENRFLSIRNNPGILNDNLELRNALLDFIADFSNWDNSTKKEYLETSRILTQTAHEGLGGEVGTKPLVVDPFAGGGSIPLEALRVGADAFASDLNPVAVLLNKVVLEYIPKYGQKLADEVRKWGEWIKKEAEKELAEFYPKDPDGSTPIAYLWARTIKCEGPGCGSEVPLMRSLWLAKRGKNSIALRMVPKPGLKKVEFEIINDAKPSDVMDGTVKRGSATCPCCGYTTPVASVRVQLKARKGGANDARLFCVVITKPSQQGRFYRLPSVRDLEAVKKAVVELERKKKEHNGKLSLVPDEPLPPQGTLGFRVQLYGVLEWGDLFTVRQALSLSTLVQKIQEVGKKLVDKHNKNLADAIQTCLAIALDRQTDYLSSLTIWANSGEFIAHTFGRQALPIVWEWPECNLWANGSGNWQGAIEWVSLVIEANISDIQYTGHSTLNSATLHPLPTSAARCFFTDPPYYDAVPYADLSDFFIVWLRRSVGNLHPDLLHDTLAPKADECIVDEVKGKDKKYFEINMGKAMAEGKRVLLSEGIGIVVFAHKSTSGWEAQLKSMLDAGWIITASWPIDTERPGRLRAQDSAALASSIHLVCRPRQTDETGDWRDVLSELPKRIHEWMPRLSEEGIVGADAIFACLGPALEIFSRYSSVEKASGETVTLKEYLEQVWAAVAKEALAMIFSGADATGFEEDARLTAMWLWTLKTVDTVGSNIDLSDDEAEDNTGKNKKGKASGGFALEYDAARKIAQGWVSILRI
ncbi:MAG: DUF1156 domain-containing protein [Spirochaetales bacterium]|nr:DUF1156 domain-containing protein [Spirochaetales bacterium]